MELHFRDCIVLLRVLLRDFGEKVHVIGEARRGGAYPMCQVPEDDSGDLEHAA